MATRDFTAYLSLPLRSNVRIGERLCEYGKLAGKGRPECNWTIDSTAIPCYQKLVSLSNAAYALNSPCKSILPLFVSDFQCINIDKTACEIEPCVAPTRTTSLCRSVINGPHCTSDRQSGRCLPPEVSGHTGGLHGGACENAGYVLTIEGEAYSVAYKLICTVSIRLRMAHDSW
jgi:hypothetical protein